MIFIQKLAGHSKQYALLLGLLCVLGFMPSLCAAENLHVLVVLSDNAAPYETFLKTFNQNLPSSIQSSVKRLVVAPAEERLHADLIVTVGVKAAEWAAVRTSSPMLAAMLPSNKFVAIQSKQANPKQLSAIYLDQSWRRQAHLIHVAFPDSKKIGVLYTPDASLDLDAMQRQLTELGIQLVKQALKSNSDISTDLEAVLSRSEVLLAVADSNIYNASNIRNILLSSYRHGVPMVGLSQSYINAGALCAVFSTPEQLAAQAVAVTLSFAQTKKLPEPQFPMLYSIAVNAEVARTLGLTVHTPDSLRIEMERSESRGMR